MMPRYQSDSNAIRNWAQNCLLPQNGSLRKFFTASRSYFGELGERILAEEPATGFESTTEAGLVELWDGF